MRRQAIRYRPILREPPVIVLGEPDSLPWGGVVMVAVGLFLLAVAVVMGVLRWVVG